MINIIIRAIFIPFILAVFLALLLTTFLTSLFVGSGYIISHLFGFPLLGATALSVGVFFAFLFAIFFLVYSSENDSLIIRNMKNNGCDCSVCRTKSAKRVNKKPRQHKSKDSASEG